MLNYYKILGIPNFSDIKAVQTAFRSLAKLYHPDKNSGNPLYESKFKEVNAAYQILGNQKSKSIYDQKLDYLLNPPLVSKPTILTTPIPKYVKKETPIFYGDSQKTFIQYATVFLFAMLVLVGAANFFDKNKSTEDLLELKNQSLNNGLVKAKARKDYELAASYLDSIQFFGYSPKTWENESKIIIKAMEDKLRLNFKAQKTKAIIEYWNIIEKISERNSIETAIDCRYMSFLSFIKQQNYKRAEDQALFFLKKQLNSKNLIIVADTLLSHKRRSVAKELLKTSVSNLINDAKTEYQMMAESYLRVLDDDKWVSRALLQDIVLNKNTELEHLEWCSSILDEEDNFLLQKMQANSFDLFEKSNYSETELMRLRELYLIN